MPTIHIRKAEIVVAWDEAAGVHTYRSDCDVVLRGNSILHVGPDWQAQAGEDVEVVDGAGFMVCPGLVDIHSHLAHEPINKGYTDETGSHGLYCSNLYEYMPTMRGSDEDAPWQAHLACAELLMSGVTTVVDMSVRYDGWMDVMAQSGLRAYLAPMFRSARWFTRNGHVVEYDWDLAAGEAEMEAAFSIAQNARNHESGRLDGMIVPAQIDTCTPELMRDSHRLATERGFVWQTHAAQSVSEFHEITRRHGVTPIRWLADLGVLDKNAIIGHCIFLDDHPSTRWSTRDDLRLLAESRATVAHCPTVFLRRGMALQDSGRYLRAGARLGIGTDTYPHNMLEEMRHVGYVARLTAGTPHTLSTGDVFNAATVGGATALGRDDIGRLKASAKADVVMVDLKHPLMNPGRDPIRSLVYAAADRAVHTVYVDGRKVVSEGRALGLDIAKAAERVNTAQRRAEALVPERDLVAGRSGRQMSPLSFNEA